MAISASRFKFLDKETNVAVQDFTAISDDKVYTAPMDNLSITSDLPKIEMPDFNLEELVSDGIASVKEMIPSDSGILSAVKDISKDVAGFLPPGLDFGMKGVTDSFTGIFSKVSNLSANSLCDLINLFLGVNLLSLLLNLSPDMRKRLFMLALLALLSKLCNQKLNALSNPSGLLNIDDLKKAGASTFSNLVNPTSMGKMSKLLPSSANPILSTMSSVASMPNPLANTSNLTRLNPKLGTLI